MRPHSSIVRRLPGEFPRSVNAALYRYLYLIESDRPEVPPQWQPEIVQAIGSLNMKKLTVAALQASLVERVETAHIKQWLLTLTKTQLISLVHHLEGENG